MLTTTCAQLAYSKDLESECTVHAAAVQVGIVAGVVAVVLLIGNLAKPIYDNTIKSFPTPAEYELYEQREDRGL
jgi:hypothetical protein